MERDGSARAWGCLGLVTIGPLLVLVRAGEKLRTLLRMRKLWIPMPFSLQAYVILYQVHASREGVMVEGGERGEMPEESEIHKTGTKDG